MCGRADGPQQQSRVPSGRRDLPVVTLLDRTYGHRFMGIYLEVRTAGVVEKDGEFVV